MISQVKIETLKRAMAKRLKANEDSREQFVTYWKSNDDYSLKLTRELIERDKRRTRVCFFGESDLRNL